MKNAISIDLEDWFCVHNLSGAIKPRDWDNCELRVQQSTERLLALFEKHKTRATFFVLGWVAERLPELIRKIEAQGHEIASHGYNHLLLTEITPKEFEADLAKALEALEKCGVKTRPIGFRAPSFTVVGPVVDLRETLSWFETKPLFGWRVLVPRTKDQAGEMSDRLRAYGAVPVEVPTIAVEPPRSPAQMDRAIKGLVTGRYGWIVFTSVNAVKAVREKFTELGLDELVQGLEAREG